MDQPRPQHLVQMGRVLGRVHNRAGFLQAEEETDHPAVQVEIRQQRFGIRQGGERHRRVQGHGRAAHAGFRGQEAEQQVRGLNVGRLAVQRLVKPHERARQFVYGERNRNVLADPGAHQFEQRALVAGPSDGHHLDAGRVRFDLGGGPQRFFERCDADEEDPRANRADHADEVVLSRIVAQPADDVDLADFHQRVVQLSSQPGFGRDDDGRNHSKE